jgi:hypothetical protein
VPHGGLNIADPSMRAEEVERAANFPVSSRCNGLAEKRAQLRIRRMSPSISPDSSATVGTLEEHSGYREPGVEMSESKGLLAADLLQNRPDTLQFSTTDCASPARGLSRNDTGFLEGRDAAVRGSIECG